MKGTEYPLDRIGARRQMTRSAGPGSGGGDAIASLYLVESIRWGADNVKPANNASAAKVRSGGTL